MRRMTKDEFQQEVEAQFLAPMMGDKAPIQSVCAEDEWYIIRPAKWYLRTPWFGFPKFTYAGCALDCDDLAKIQEVYWIERNWKQMAPSGPGSGAAPALPVIRVKYVHPELGMHWSNLALTTEGWLCLDRMPDGTIQRRALPSIPYKLDF